MYVFTFVCLPAHELLLQTHCGVPFQKYEKPKFVQCLAFLGNGEVLTGDSGGILLIWSRTTVETTPGKGSKGKVRVQL